MSSPRFSTNGLGKPSANGQSTPAASLDDRESQVTTAMNARRDRLNQLWQDAEDRLKRIGFHSNVLYEANSYADDDHPDYKVYHDCLGFLKLPTGWRLCFVTTNDLYPDEYRTLKPITESSADIRLRMIPFIGKLRQRIIEQAELSIPTFDAAIAEFERTLANW